jgi:hypothetical protein
VRELSTSWLRNVPALRATDLRAKLLENDLTLAPLDVVASALETIALRAEQADPRAREVLAAAATTLTSPAHSGLVDALREEATRAGHLALARLLRRRATQVSLEQPPPAERQAGAMPAGRAFTLGERRALARGRDRTLLDRLLRDPHPLVIRNVLGNPRITEDDIVRLAARRPTFPDVQAEIAKSSRWSARPRVRLALVQNPFTPPSISVPLVALLLRPELEQVVGATDLPAVVRGAASELLERRPPVREPEGTEPPTIN